ncbi:MAG: hypothetical protein JW748_08045 [Anaerolineales bacterium]|nr:hypothetical protein [Anaerolineales bacterium]
MKNHPVLHRSTHSRIGLALAISGAAALLAILAPILPVQAASAGLSVERNRAVLDFPNTVTFQLTISAPAEIERIVLEYGVDRLTCGEVTAKAFPDFTPAARVETEWTWDMRKSGSEPPGARIWWQWRATDTDGNEQLIGRSEIIWLDTEHSWQKVTSGSIAVHWYEGGAAYGSDMLDSAVGSIRHIGELIDLHPDGTIDLYLYASYEDLRDAVLYEPGWTGGQSYGDHNIIILGIPVGYEDWGKSAIAHELMHNVVDRFTFSCLVRIPSWVHEGLAMVSEGGPGEEGMAMLQAAIDNNAIFPLRSLGGGFPEDPGKAELAYNQSYSVVDFLIRRGDAARMRSFLELLGFGMTADEALLKLFGFNVDGLDAAWRESVGADALAPDALAPTSTATIVPTYKPLSINPPAASTAVAATTASPAGVTWGFMEYLILLCICGLCLIPVIGIGAALVIGIARGKK